MFGVRGSGFGVRSSEFGVQCSKFDVRSLLLELEVEENKKPRNLSRAILFIIFSINLEPRTSNLEPRTPNLHAIACTENICLCTLDTRSL